MRERHDGFTGEKRKRFLKMLAKTGCITDSARVAGVSRKTANYWRRKDSEFARACETAIGMASSHIETLAWERAVTGIEEPVIHYGKLIGTRVKRSDSIFRMLLMASNRKKYGRMGAVARKEIEKELRAKIEAERSCIGPGKRRPRTVDELRASILEKLDEAHRRLHRMSPEGEPPPAGADGEACEHLAERRTGR